MAAAAASGPAAGAGGPGGAVAPSWVGAAALAVYSSALALAGTARHAAQAASPADPGLGAQAAAAWHWIRALHAADCELRVDLALAAAAAEGWPGRGRGASLVVPASFRAPDPPSGDEFFVGALAAGWAPS